MKKNTLPIAVSITLGILGIASSAIAEEETKTTTTTTQTTTTEPAPAPAPAAPAEPEPDTHGHFAIGAIGGLTGARNEGRGTTAQNADINDKSKFSYGGGVLFDSVMSNGFGIGLGGLFVNRKFEIGGSSYSLERTVPTVFIPLEAKFWLGEMLAVGGGAFGAVKVGNQKDKLVSGSDTLAVVSRDQRESWEFGWTVSADVTLGTDGRGLFLRGQYLYGLSDSSKDALYEEKIDDLLFMAGIRF